MSSIIRMGFALSEEGRDRLVHLTKFADADSQSALVEGILRGLTDDQAKEAYKIGNATRSINLREAQELRKKARAAVNKLTPEQLKAILEATEQK